MCSSRDEAVGLCKGYAPGREPLPPGPGLPPLNDSQWDNDQPAYKAAGILPFTGQKSSGKFLNVDSRGAGDVTAVEQLVHSRRRRGIPQVVDQNGCIQQDEHLPDLSSVRSPFIPHPRRRIGVPRMSIGRYGPSGRTDQRALLSMLEGRGDRFSNELCPSPRTGRCVDLGDDLVGQFYV